MGAALSHGIFDLLSKELLKGDSSKDKDPNPQVPQPRRRFAHHNGKAPEPDPWEGLTDDFGIEQSHHLTLIKPQIALCSVIKDESTIVLAALSTEAHMFTVFDKQDMEDPVNAKVMRR